MARGDWSLGKIIDTYFKFGYGGDTYLGQVLSLKDANSTDFGLLPAHWKDPNDPNIEEGVKCCFPGIIEKHGNKEYNSTGLLHLLLAQLVYHSEFLREIATKFRGHDFNLLPMVFDKPELLKALKENVTLDPSPDMPVATGIPPHITHSIQLQGVIDICGEVKDAVVTLETTIKDTIHSAIDEKVKSDGNVNLTILTDALEKFRVDTLEDLVDRLSSSSAPSSAIQETVNAPIITANCLTFMYDKRSWCVPKSFTFPENTNLSNAWRRWWLGSIVSESGQQYKIKAYRLLSDKDLPTAKAKNDLKTSGDLS